MVKKMKIDGKNFLISIAVLYVFIFLFSYSFFMISTPLITGHATISQAQNVSNDAINYLAFKKTVKIISIVFVVVLLILIISFVYLKKIQKIDRYKKKYYKALNIKNQ